MGYPCRILVHHTLLLFNFGFVGNRFISFSTIIIMMISAPHIARSVGGRKPFSFLIVSKSSRTIPSNVRGSKDLELVFNSLPPRALSEFTASLSFFPVKLKFDRTACVVRQTHPANPFHENQPHFPEPSYWYCEIFRNRIIILYGDRIKWMVMASGTVDC